MSRALGRLLGRLPWPWIARLSMLVSIGILAWGLPQLVDGDWSRFLTSTGHHAWIVGWLFVVSHLARSRTLFNVAGAWLGGWFTAIWVAVDATSGTVLDDRRHDPDRAAGDPSLSNGTELLALGDQVVLVAGGRLLGYDVADLSHRWETELESGNSFDLVPVDDGAWVGWREGETTRIARLDPTDGSVTEVAVREGQVPGRRGVVGTPDGGLVVGLTGDDERIVALGPDGNEVWETELGEDERAPRWFTVAGEALVGFTGGQEISAFDLGDGSVRWTARPTSFTNNDGQVIGLDDGTVVLASFGGAFLEAVDPDGAAAWEVPSEAIFDEGGAPSVSVLGPLTDDDVIGVSRTEGGLLVVAVPTSGPRDR